MTVGTIAVSAVRVVVEVVVVRRVMVASALYSLRAAHPSQVSVRPSVGVDVNEVAVAVQHSSGRVGHR
jgi:hypothetical protein